MSQAPHEDRDEGQEEPRFVLHHVPWWTYVALRDAMDEGHPGLKMTYLEGALELMSPSQLHEEVKKVIARLLEIWADETGVDLRGFGSTTFRKEAKRRGLEPDECYALGPLAEEQVPSIAIEIELSQSLVDKMAVYAGLGIAEVWSWTPKAGSIAVHRLEGDQYLRQTRSAVLPDLDLDILARFVRPGESHTQLGRDYRAALKKH
jgi:Uma2 family endonuclease